MQGMTLSAVKDVLESLDFLSTSMRVFGCEVRTVCVCVTKNQR
jgi:hypothetical protein